jgi:hypothetical protein
MTCLRNTPVWLVVSAVTLAGPAPLVVAQSPERSIQRLRGVVDQDQTWSGLVIITDDLVIQDATVTVAAGTEVEFAHHVSGSHPTLTVGAVVRSGGHLRLLATAEQPITFRTRPGTNPGRLVINVRSRIIPTKLVGSDPLELTPADYVPDDVAWQHVRFENLGHLRRRRRGEKAALVAEPAVTFNLIGAAHTLGVANCTFDHTTRFLVRAADGAKITILANQFDHPTERVSVELFGHEGAAPVGPVVITRNVLAAALHLHAAPATIADNVLIGLDAAMVIEEDSSSETMIARNYIHNTTEEDNGRYCLRCDNPAAAIEDNIFRGGTTCVWTGSRQMTGNVFIAASNLTSRFVKNARTHQLIHSLPSGAQFERNLLLGPAYSLLMPQPASARRGQEQDPGTTVIRNNLFDGFADSNRAIHLNPLGCGPVSVSVVNNLFLRIGTLVYDEGRTADTLTYADHNAVAPPAARAFDQVKVAGTIQGEPGWAAKDVQAEDTFSLALTGSLLRRVPDYDPEILARKIGVGQIRQQLFDAYRPLAHSPLVRAGRPKGAADAVSPPSIGPSEPAGGQTGSFTAENAARPSAATEHE